MKRRVKIFVNSRSLGALAVLLNLILLAPEAVAGQQDASIIGQVTDESGAVLPGVTVTATSPALQMPELTVVTDVRGEYRLTPLPIGTYVVMYALSGFQSVRREGVRLTAGFSAKVDVPMKIGALAETITVSGASPVVDVTSTRTTTQLTREALELIPTSRNGVIGLMAQAPGVRPNLDVGGSTLNAVPNFRAFGQSGESYQQIEGVSTTSPNTDTQGGQFNDYTAFEEANIGTLGHDAEIPSRGVNLNLVVKSGGNDFHGTGFWAQTPSKWQSKNIDAALAAQGVTSGNPLKARWDVSGELGGRIIRDKLWFFFGTRKRSEDRVVVNAFKPDGSPMVTSQSQPSATEKLTYQMSRANRIVGYMMWGQKHAIGGVSQFTEWDTRYLQVNNSRNGKIEWQSVPTSSLVTSLQYGYWGYLGPYAGFSDQVATTDQLTSRVTGLGTIVGRNSLENHHHARGSVSWFRPDLLGGNHQIKTGFDYLAGRGDRPFDSKAGGNYQLVFRNGVPFQMNVWNYPVVPFDLMHYLAIYVQDSWTIRRRLTLNLGLRYAHDNGFAPAQCRDAADAPGNAAFPASCFPEVQMRIWNPIVPRVRVAYDITGDGKTVIKGGWGRYANTRKADEVQMVNRNTAATASYVWHDLNNNKRYEPGEVNLDPNGPDLKSLTVTSGGSGGALANAVPNPNELEPMTDELSLSVERELIPNFALRGTGVYSRAFNVHRLVNNKRPYGVYNIPITNPDPGPDGRVGTADDPGTVVTYFDYPASYAGIAFQESMLTNDPQATQTYSSLEVAASKRMSSGWQLMASYSATKTHDPYVINAGGGNDTPVNTIDPNAEIFSLNNTWEWLGRVSGAYTFPAGIMASANFEHRSGNSFARTVSAAGGQQIRSLTVRVEPIGTRRLPNINLLDVRVEKAVRLSASQRLLLRLNMYNFLNVNTVTSVTSLSGPNFLRPGAIMPPRTFELSASYAF